jgi:hypothetical protein
VRTVLCRKVSGGYLFYIQSPNGEFELVYMGGKDDLGQAVTDIFTIRNDFTHWQVKSGALADTDNPQASIVQYFG